jgi:hypothetical protein
MMVLMWAVGTKQSATEVEGEPGLHLCVGGCVGVCVGGWMMDDGDIVFAAGNYAVTQHNHPLRFMVVSDIPASGSKSHTCDLYACMHAFMFCFVIIIIIIIIIIMHSSSDPPHRCRHPISLGMPLSRCKLCDFDLCETCALQAQEASEAVHEHPLAAFIVGPESTMTPPLVCDQCNAPCDVIAFHCVQCGFDLCTLCYANDGKDVVAK